jgi:hypothetical protein
LSCVVSPESDAGRCFLKDIDFDVIVFSGFDRFCYTEDENHYRKFIFDQEIRSHDSEVLNRNPLKSKGTFGILCPISLKNLQPH